MRRLNFKDDTLQDNKEKDRQRIAAQVEEFLARGGKPKQVEPGATGEERLPPQMRKPKNHYYPSLTITEYAEKMEIHPNSLFNRTVHKDPKKRLNASRAEPGRPRLITLEEQKRFEEDNQAWINRYSKRK